MNHWEDDPEDPGSVDVGRDDNSVDTLPCPYCKKDLYEGAEVCPNCGSYVVDDDIPRRRPWWVVVALVLTLAAIVLQWVFRRA